MHLLKGLSDEGSMRPFMPDNNLSRKMNYSKNPKSQVNFDEICLTTDRVFSPCKIIYFYIAFEIK